MGAIYHQHKIIILTILIVAAGLKTIQAQETLYGNETKEEDKLSNIDISNEEIEKFVEVYEQMSELEAQYNLKILDIIEKKGMEIDRYETISAAQRMDYDIEIDREEMALYRNIQKEIEREKKATHQQMERILLNYQFEKERYNSILNKIAEDSTFRVKFDSIHQGKMNK
ncbi:MAG: hypothetical protein ACLFNL_03125 [Bacteroidales bacterium]